MAIHVPRTDSSSTAEPVTVSDCVACLNSGDNVIVLSCTINTVDSSDGITGVGLVLNSSAGEELASIYVDMSSGSKSASPAINLPVGKLNEGDGVLAAAQGECNGQHFFFEQNLTVGKCQEPT